MHVKSEAGVTQCKNILIAINPLELGIELVGVVTCKIDSLPYLLDGEILRPDGHQHELVRMPVALISHKYLKRNFHSNGKLCRSGDIQCSVSGDCFRAGEIFCYSWDIRRRYEILENPHNGIGTEIYRYEKWKSRFGSNFELFNSEVDVNKLPTIFTPTSGKISSYYFSE